MYDEWCDRTPIVSLLNKNVIFMNLFVFCMFCVFFFFSLNAIWFIADVCINVNLLCVCVWLVFNFYFRDLPLVKAF